MNKVYNILKQSSWASSLVFIVVFAAMAPAFFAISGLPLVWLWRAILVAAIGGVASFFYALAWLIAFEFRFFGLRRMDASVPLAPGGRILTAELATAAGEGFFPRGRALYLTTASLVFVPVRRRFP